MNFENKNSTENLNDWLGTRICLANFVNQSGFRKLAANQSQVEGNRGKLSGT